jgi:hypothetical protein
MSGKYGPGITNSSGFYHGKHSTTDGDNAARKAYFREQSFGQTGDLRKYKDQEVPDGPTVTNTLFNSGPGKWGGRKSKKSKKSIKSKKSRKSRKSRRNKK